MNVRLAGYAARILERRSAYRLYVEKCEGKRQFERPRRSWGIILKWIYKTWNVWAWTGLM
jgi:hypothetical protein